MEQQMEIEMEVGHPPEGGGTLEFIALFSCYPLMQPLILYPKRDHNFDSLSYGIYRGFQKKVLYRDHIAFSTG